MSASVISINSDVFLNKDKITLININDDDVMMQAVYLFTNKSPKLKLLFGKSYDEERSIAVLYVSLFDTVIKHLAECKKCRIKYWKEYLKSDKNNLTFECSHKFYREDILKVCKSTEFEFCEKNIKPNPNCILIGDYLRYFQQKVVSADDCADFSENNDLKIKSNKNNTKFTIYEITPPIKLGLSKKDLEKHIVFQIEDIEKRKETNVTTALALKKSSVFVPHDVVELYLNFHNKITYYS